MRFTNTDPNQTAEFIREQAGVAAASTALTVEVDGRPMIADAEAYDVAHYPTGEVRVTTLQGPVLIAPGAAYGLAIVSNANEVGYICKKCGDVAPMGVGYASNEPAAIQRSPYTTECACGWSTTAN